MAGPTAQAARLMRMSRSRWFLALATVPSGLLAMSWALTEPLPGSAPARDVTAAKPAGPSSPYVEMAAALEWPSERMEGDPAKRLLLAILLRCEKRLASEPGYTARFRKQERIGDRLNPEQTIAMKVRHEPFAVYLRFLTPYEGKEVIFAEGRFDNHLIGHETGIARHLLPRLKLDPNSRFALADNRHPITSAGLLNLTRKLIYYREMDLKDDDAVTVLDWDVDETGTRRPRSIHLHSNPHADRPFAKAVVLYDLDRMIPISFSGYDWPGDDASDTELLLGERYEYDNFEPTASLSENDFDPANPNYEFSRF
jgi:hypothetical protein